MDKYKGKKIKILDIGCGTGELPLGLASKNIEITAVDFNDKSLEIARLRAKKFKIKNVNFKKMDFTKDNLLSNYYDFIFSIGVLHHLKNPEKSFEKLTRSIKVGGYVVIGIYNPYGSFKVRVKRGLLQLLAGNNFEKKIEIYRKFFYRKPLTEEEKVAVADAFANPYRRYYSFEQLLEWFKKNEIEYLDSAPPLELSKNLKLFKEVLSGFITGGSIDLTGTWQKINYESSTSSWERSKIITFLTQLSWILIGRGELINIIGRKVIKNET